VILWLSLAAFAWLVIAVIVAPVVGRRLRRARETQTTPEPGDVDPVMAAADEILTLTCPVCSGHRCSSDADRCACPRKCDFRGCPAPDTSVFVLTPEEKAKFDEMVRGFRK
jgi:hypothetical protein